MCGESSYPLLQRCAVDRDAVAWDELVRRHEPGLRRAIERSMRAVGEQPRREDVEERLQDVYCRLLERDARRLRRFRGDSEGEAVSYLARVARTVVLDAARERRAVKRGAGAESEAGAAGAERVADRAAGPEERTLRRERRRIFLEHCRRALGGQRSAHAERNARIVRLALLEGWTSREISRAVGGALREAGVDSLVHRVRRRLREQGLTVPLR
jgi:RNA polymerase sigma factor (sigma-70 family)